MGNCSTCSESASDKNKKKLYDKAAKTDINGTETSKPMSPLPSPPPPEEADSNSDFEIEDEDDEDTVAEMKHTENAPFKRKVSGQLDLPLKWEEIQEYVATDRTAEFTRNPKYDKLYEEHRKNTKENYGSIYDKIEAVEMGYPTRQNDDGKLVVVREEGDEKTVFCKNLFPYFIEEGISHDLVFSTFKDGLSDEEVNDFLKQHIDHDQYDVFWYENPPHMKSLPLLWHVQVFSRKKKKKAAPKED